MRLDQFNILLNHLTEKTIILLCKALVVGMASLATTAIAICWFYGANL